MNEHSSPSNWRTEIQRLHGAYAPGTIRAYYADLEAFVDWCLARGEDPFPTDTDVLCEYIAHVGQTKSISTVKRRLYAIRKMHKLFRLPDPTTDEAVNIAFRRVRRAKLARPRQARGITADDLRNFIATEPDTPIGLRNRAMLALGYELLTRRMELISLTTEDVTFQPDGTLKLVIRRGRSDPFGMGRIGYTSKATAEKLKAWIEWRGPDIFWLFCPIYKNKPINRDLSPTTVKRIIKNAAKRTGYDTVSINEFSGHSLRVGAAQELLHRGFDAVAIMRAGGWKTVAVLARYLENASQNVWK